MNNRKQHVTCENVTAVTSFIYLILFSLSLSDEVQFLKVIFRAFACITVQLERDRKGGERMGKGSQVGIEPGLLLWVYGAHTLHVELQVASLCANFE